MRFFAIAGWAFLLTGCAQAIGPNASEVGDAIGVSADQIRDLACSGIPEEPTEFSCRYQLRGEDSEVQAQDVMMAIDGSTWVVIDGPGPVPTEPEVVPTSIDEASAPAAIESYLLRNFSPIGPPDYAEAAYAYALFDLNGDGSDEIVARVAVSRWFCGATGGCPLIVLTREGDGWRHVGHVTITKLPVGVLETSTNGWRDLVSRAAAGAFDSHWFRRIPFQGETYAANPTAPPAERLAHDPQMTILINEQSATYPIPYATHQSRAPQALRVEAAGDGAEPAR